MYHSLTSYTFCNNKQWTSIASKQTNKQKNLQKSENIQTSKIKEVFQYQQCFKKYKLLLSSKSYDWTHFFPVIELR